MKRLKSRTAAFAVICLFAAPVSIVRGDSFADPGFENYALSSGGFLQPASGPWVFTNDAGVVRPYSPNSSTGPLNTWSATFSAMEGQQYASTYAGLDHIHQTVAFSTAGDYMISVYAAAPNGSLTIPSVGTWSVGDGEFTFTLGNSDIGSLHAVPAGSSWALYSAAFTIDSPGNYALGVRNTETTPCFVNYDSFSLQSVPEPSTIVLLAAGAASLLFMEWRRRKRG
jgi:hypothetical protein